MPLDEHGRKYSGGASSVGHRARRRAAAAAGAVRAAQVTGRHVSGQVGPLSRCLRKTSRNWTITGEHAWVPSAGDRSRLPGLPGPGVQPQFGMRAWSANAPGRDLPCSACGYLYRFKLITWRLTWGLCDQLRRLVVLVDHATEDLAPSDRQVQRRAGLAVLVGRSLLAGLVRAVAVVMAGVLAED